LGTDVGKVRQALRDAGGVGLLDSWLGFGELPRSVKSGMGKKEADKLRAALEEAGAKVRLWLRA
jgi:ribosomal protein L7/L12